MSRCSGHAVSTNALHIKQPRGTGVCVQHFVVLYIQLGHLGTLLVTFRRHSFSGISNWRPWGFCSLGHAPDTNVHESQLNTWLTLRKKNDPWGPGVFSLWRLTLLWAGNWTDLWCSLPNWIIVGSYEKKLNFAFALVSDYRISIVEMFLRFGY